MTVKPGVTRVQFFILESLIYSSQIFMFFVAAVLASGMLNDELALTKFVESTLHDGSTGEVVYIIVSAFLTLGVFSFIAFFLKKNKWLDEVSKAVVKEIPRTIYFFGSSVSGSMLAVSVFVAKNPGVDVPPANAWLLMVLVFSLGAFLFGFALSYGMNRKDLHP